MLFEAMSRLMADGAGVLSSAVGAYRRRNGKMNDGNRYPTPAMGNTAVKRTREAAHFGGRNAADQK